jgi:membrane protein YqaA with SNARE-associated domain
MFSQMLRRIYDNVLLLSSRPNALYWLVLVAFVESSFFPIPPDIMIIPMVLATPSKAWKIAGYAMVASVIGGYLGYAIGMFGYEVIAKPLIAFYGYSEAFNEFSRYYHEWGAWIVFGAGLTPFPYKVITITSGVLGLNIWVFGIASVLARGIRFYLIAFLLKRFGEPMKVFIEKNLGLLTVIFVLLLFAGFYAVKYL